MTTYGCRVNPWLSRSTRSASVRRAIAGRLSCALIARFHPRRRPGSPRRRGGPATLGCLAAHRCVQSMGRWRSVWATAPSPCARSWKGSTWIAMTHLRSAKPAGSSESCTARTPAGSRTVRRRARGPPASGLEIMTRRVCGMRSWTGGFSLSNGAAAGSGGVASSTGTSGPTMRTELRLNARYSLTDPGDVEYNTALQLAFAQRRRQPVAPLLAPLSRRRRRIFQSRRPRAADSRYGKL